MCVRECERYLPRQQQSPAFRVSREGIKEDAPLRSLNSSHSHIHTMIITLLSIAMYRGGFEPPTFCSKVKYLSCPLLSLLHPGLRVYLPTQSAGTCCSTRGVQSGPWTGVPPQTERVPTSTLPSTAMETRTSSTTSARPTPSPASSSSGTWAAWTTTPGTHTHTILHYNTRYTHTHNPGLQHPVHTHTQSWTTTPGTHTHTILDHLHIKYVCYVCVSAVD